MTNNVTDDNSATRNTTSWTLSNPPVYPETQIALMLWKVWPPCILLLGGFGNIATIFVMRLIKDHNSSQHAILIALAVSDLTLLYTGTLRHWLYYLFNVDLRSLHTVTCKLHIWLVYTSGTASAWLLTFVTVQRTLAVKWPLKMRTVFSLKRTWGITIAVVVAAAGVNFHWVVGMKVVNNRCTATWSASYRALTVLWRWVDMCLSSLLPAGCLLVCDVILSSTLYKATLVPSASVSSVSNVTTAQYTHSRRKTASRTTVMILTLSCTFLLLTLPVCVHLVWEYYADVFVNKASRLYAQGTLVFAVTFLLWYTNSAVNFLLYCFTGTKFKKAFLSWIRCGPRQEPGMSSVGEKR
ncbi:hypothetical protein ACOMHN_036980 [Nucella lapillus]